MIKKSKDKFIMLKILKRNKQKILKINLLENKHK